MAAEAAAPRAIRRARCGQQRCRSGSASGIGQVTFALLLVLAAVFAVALLVKRLRAVTGAGANGIEVLAQTSLGAKERAVIVRVGGERLLLGVASGQVSLLQTLPPDAPPHRLHRPMARPYKPELRRAAARRASVDEAQGAQADRHAAALHGWRHAAAGDRHGCRAGHSCGGRAGHAGRAELFR